MQALGSYIGAYVMLAYLFLQLPIREPWRERGFALLNMGGVYACLFIGSKHAGAFFLSSLLYVLLFYGLLHLYTRKPTGLRYATAILLPLGILSIMKTADTAILLGFSYLVFRLTYLVYELHAGKVQKPSLVSYLGFAFFPLTFALGPISPYALYRRSLDVPDRSQTPLRRSLMRIWVGMLKVYLLAPLFNSMSFSGFWFNGYYHGISDFIIACTSSWLFIYFNFSGAIDMVIGMAGVLNIRVQENFDNTLIARNIGDFWKRMHMTLTQYLRNIVFTPGLLFLGHLTGPRFYHANVIVMTMATLILIGLWHNVSYSFFIFGLMHGAALSVFYLWSLWWKGLPEPIRRLPDTLPWRLATTALTFLYVSSSSLFFLHSWDEVQRILALLKW